MSSLHEDGRTQLHGRTAVGSRAAGACSHHVVRAAEACSLRRHGPTGARSCVRAVGTHTSAQEESPTRKAEGGRSKEGDGMVDGSEEWRLVRKRDLLTIVSNWQANRAGDGGANEKEKW